MVQRMPNVSLTQCALMNQIKTVYQTAKPTQLGAAIWAPLRPGDTTEYTSRAKRNDYVGISPLLFHLCRQILIPHPFFTAVQLQFPWFHPLLFLPVSLLIQLVGEPMAWGLEIEITEIEFNIITLFFSFLWHRWETHDFLCEVELLLALTRQKGKAGRWKGKQVKKLSKKAQLEPKNMDNEKNQITTTGVDYK